MFTCWEMKKIYTPLNTTKTVFLYYFFPLALFRQKKNWHPISPLYIIQCRHQSLGKRTKDWGERERTISGFVW